MNKVMNKAMKVLPAILLAVIIGMIVMIIPAFAEGDNKDTTATTTSASHTIDEQSSTDGGNSVDGLKALGAGIAIGLAACGGAIGMGSSVGKSVEGISRQPEVESKIRTTLMLGLVFIETAIIYALLVVILIIFVL